MADPQIVQQTQTTIPDYAKRYVEDLLGQGAASIYRTQGTTNGMPNIVGFQPYRPYQGTREAQFTPLQQQSYNAASQLRVPEQMYDASRIAQSAAARAGQSAYNPSGYQAGMATAPQLERFQMGPAQQVYSRENIAPSMSGAQMSYDPLLRDYQMGPAQSVAADRVGTAQMNAARMQYDPNLRNYQMGPAQSVTADRVGTAQMNAARMQFDPNLRNYQMGPAQEVRTQSFAQPGASGAYMSPYMQDVVGIQQREAQRQADISATQRGARFAGAGAFGGARQAIENAEAQRNLSTQMGDIQATGLQSAYQQAQQQFNADQARALAANQGNQQAGLTVGGQNLQSLLGTQQLGTQTGLQAALANLGSEQQAGVQNMAAYLQSAGMNQQAALQAALANQQAGLTVGGQNLQSMQNTQQLNANIGLQSALANLNTEQQAGVQNMAAYLQSAGMNQQAALQAALANQQAGLTVGRENLGARQNTQQLGANIGLQTGLANLNNAQQAGVQNLSAYQQNQALNSQQAMQAALANQAAGMNVGQQNLQALQNTQQLGAQNSMQAQLANQQAMQNAAQLREQSAQYGAGFGLQGLQTAMQGAGQLGQLGQNISNMNMGNIGLQNQFGTQQQGAIQSGLNNQYQDYLNQENLPFRQMGFMSDMLRGTAGLGQSSLYQYQQPASTTNQILGIGTQLAGLGKLGLKKGGAVGSGLADLAIANMA
jgi:hypothetical protein